jgi:hypothetical protein
MWSIQLPCARSRFDPNEVFVAIQATIDPDAEN